MQFTVISLLSVFAAVAAATSVDQGSATISGGVVGNFNAETMAYIHKIAAEQPVGVGSIDGRGERPTRRADSVGNCSTGTAQCCNQVITDDSAKQTIAGLAGLNSIVGDIALGCSQLPIGALPVAAQNVCAQKSLCCDNVTQDGLINFGCINIPIN